MIIIEAGATQTKVCKINNGVAEAVSYFNGISPTYMSESAIQAILSIVLANNDDDQGIFYYGTGCVSETAKIKMASCLRIWSKSENIHIASDLLGAARAIARSNKGQVNILGTGSASCLYNGETLDQVYFNTGYLFGDYGSGFHIGQSILRAYFEGKLSESIEQSIEDFAQLNKQDLVRKIYKAEQPKSTIANFAKCAALLKSDPDIKHLIKMSFQLFIAHQIGLNPACLSTPQYFVGSIAHYFEKELQECLKESKLELAGICESPIKDLVQYHLAYSK